MRLHNNDSISEEIARIGYTKDSYEVYVVTDDLGTIPHFHYRKGIYDRDLFHTCIKMENAEYFHHDGNEDVLSKEQQRELIEFLNSKPLKANYDTNWQFLISMWNVNNPNTEIIGNQAMPNYESLK